MTEFLGTNGGQIAYKVTGLTAAADEVVAVRPELVARPPLGSALAGGRRLAGAPDGHPLLDLVHVAGA